jgi:hypothetical protein
MYFGLARLRLALLRKLGWRGFVRFKQQQVLLKDLSRGLFLRLVLRGSKLRESALAPSRNRSPQATKEASTASSEVAKNLAS